MVCNESRHVARRHNKVAHLTGFGILVHDKLPVNNSASEGVLQIHVMGKEESVLEVVFIVSVDLTHDVNDVETRRR